MAKKLVAYYRVSTEKQGRSGLGLEGQEAAVQAYAEREGGAIIATYVEIESGRKAERPELEKAIGHARLAKATLVVAKLDRLARNVAFLARLMETGIEFVACDNPHATPLTVHILAAVAEAEARAISERTKAALAAAKKRGVKLGSARKGHWKGLEARRKAGAKAGARVSAAVRGRAVEDMLAIVGPLVTELRAEGLSLQAIADALNERGFTTRRGNPWSATAVHRVLRKLEEAAR